ncbi:MAG: D-glycerate dehydrogenase [Candidatus Obscuribacterales bacterium]|nr:D-glycerate dehydrogenase [Candidatus Obscuribacterales bacterium]
MKVKVLVLGRLLQSLHEKLVEHAEIEYVDREAPLAQDMLMAHLKGKEAVISEPLDTISSELMDACPSLKLISNRAVGFDNVNLMQATQRSIVVTNTPGVLDAATADLAMALLLACARRICEADRYVRQGKWTGFKSDLMLGPDLFGKTAGIIGIGRIGQAFAQRARAFGLKLVYTRNAPRDEQDDKFKDEFHAQRVELEELLQRADFISIHCPLNSQTRHLIGQAELDRMKPECILINTARGAIIDQQALVSHLVQRRIYAAGLDVFENEPEVPQQLLELDNVVLLPHIGSACFETRRRMSELAVDAVIAAFSGSRPEHVVNADAWNQERWDLITKEHQTATSK